MPDGHSPLAVPNRVLGLTGPAGGGKSFLLALFGEEGLPTVEADALYRLLSAPGAPAARAIAEEFGLSYLGPDGSIDREALGRRVFGDEAERERLDRLTHPLLRASVGERLAELASAGARAAVLEAAVLFEAGLDGWCDEVWWVEAPAELRIERLIASRGWSRERAARLVAAQRGTPGPEQRVDLVVDGTADAEVLRELVRSWGAHARDDGHG